MIPIVAAKADATTAVASARVDIRGDGAGRLFLRQRACFRWPAEVKRPDEGCARGVGSTGAVCSEQAGRRHDRMAGIKRIVRFTGRRIPPSRHVAPAKRYPPNFSSHGKYLSRKERVQKQSRVRAIIPSTHAFLLFQQTPLTIGVKGKVLGGRQTRT